ncbi:hypothetical protein HUW46_02072 [Amycolatopsis sp. CA-230715]|nr:hypothetical protein HUW46_02072 [Amycolatopsis sp. CA-230715]
MVGGNGGQLWMKWDNGRALSLLVEEDPYDVIGTHVGEFVRLVRKSVPELEDLQLHRETAGHLVLGMIRVRRDQRGNGVGERTMRLLVEWADFHGLVLSASASPEDEPPWTKVGRHSYWLGRHGFRLTEGSKRKSVIRERYYRLPKGERP